jgi:hypothetical protein
MASGLTRSVRRFVKYDLGPTGVKYAVMFAFVLVGCIIVFSSWWQTPAKLAKKPPPRVVKSAAKQPPDWKLPDWQSGSPTKLRSNVRPNAKGH